MSLSDVKIRLIQPTFLDPYKFGLYIFRKGDMGMDSKYLSKAEWEPADPTAFDPPPLISFNNNRVQELFNELWQLGFRPSQGTEPTQAVQAHLEDMRKLVFHRFGIKEEER